ncbi:MAG: glycosyltransferase family 9 protein [Bacteroidetes bacterium]|nr:glycosyltransferase family 9 protein [Bacteroidota bacterium]
MISTQTLVRLDSLFKIPWIFFHRAIANRNIKTKQSAPVLVIKFFGWGSVAKLVAMCEGTGVDKSQIVLLTQPQHEEISRMLGITHFLFIRFDKFFNFFYDCFKIWNHIKKDKIKCIVDFERCSNSISLFRSMLALRLRCPTISFYNQKKDLFLKSDTIFGVDWLSHHQMYNKGIEYLPKCSNQKKQLNIPVDRSKILININASKYLLARRLHRNQFLKVIQLIHNEKRYTAFHFTGSPNEKQYVQELVDELKNFQIESHNQANEWNLSQLARELSRCALFVTNDSGPLHLAMLLQTPTLAIWGPTQPAQFGYERKPNLTNITLRLPCSPCFVRPTSKAGIECHNRIDCMNINEKLISKNVIELFSGTSNDRMIEVSPSLYEILSDGN